MISVTRTGWTTSLLPNVSFFDIIYIQSSLRFFFQPCSMLGFMRNKSELCKYKSSTEENSHENSGAINSLSHLCHKILQHLLKFMLLVRRHRITSKHFDSNVFKRISLTPSLEFFVWAARKSKQNFYVIPIFVHPLSVSSCCMKCNLLQKKTFL